MDLVEVLGFLFMLSTMELGRVNFAYFDHLVPHVNWLISCPGISD